ncbi:MAG TPA: hypothetical protein EYO39_01010 [Nitrospirales bacterium]|nr:hypothetical protein [Nitrospirales bacterium]
MKYFRLVTAILGFALLAGCAEKSEESASEYADRLQNMAVAIGQNELARFNAADMLYKNIPELHSVQIPIMNTYNHAWAKTYRRYTDFSVVDITRSASLVSPISYSITFQYDQFSTQDRSTETAGAKELAIEDTRFNLRFSDSFTRYYFCNEDGLLVDPTPPLPVRPDFFQRAYNDEAKLGSLR